MNIEIGSHNTGGRFIKVKFQCNMLHMEDNLYKVISVLCDPISMFPHKTDMTILLSSNVTFHINLTFIKRPPVLCDPISMWDPISIGST